MHANEASRDLDLQPELLQAAKAKKEWADERDKVAKKAAKATRKAAAASELITVEDIRSGAAVLFHSDPPQLVLHAHPIAVTHLENVLVLEYFYQLYSIFSILNLNLVLKLVHKPVHYFKINL